MPYIGINVPKRHCSGIHEGVKQTLYQYEDAKQASCQYYGAASASASDIAP